MIDLNVRKTSPPICSTEKQCGEHYINILAMIKIGILDVAFGNKYLKQLDLVNNIYKVWCSTPGCEEMLPNEAFDYHDTIGICDVCDKTTCRKCHQSGESHTGFPILTFLEDIYLPKVYECPQKDELQVSRQKIARAFDKDFVECPSCFMGVERADACIHMT